MEGSRKVRNCSSFLEQLDPDETTAEIGGPSLSVRKVNGLDYLKRAAGVIGGTATLALLANVAPVIAAYTGPYMDEAVFGDPRLTFIYEDGVTHVTVDSRFCRELGQGWKPYIEGILENGSGWIQTRQFAEIERAATKSDAARRPEGKIEIGCAEEDKDGFKLNEKPGFTVRLGETDVWVHVDSEGRIKRSGW